MKTLNHESKRFNLISIVKRAEKAPIRVIVASSILLAILLESLSRRSIAMCIGFVIDNPIMFLVNVLILLLTLSVALIFSKKYFFVLLISTVWLGLGIANFVMQSFRLTPLTAMDFYLLNSGFGIIGTFLNPGQILILLALIVTVIALLVLLWRKVKKSRVKLWVALSMISTTALLLLLLIMIAFKVNALSGKFPNLMDAYSDYGFPYCFSNSVIDHGISRPSDYSKDKINEILSKLDEESENSTVATAEANVIMVQLESFMDVNELTDYSNSVNPIPNFTMLKENYSSGKLMVPVYGAGTINTEFEILTGMDTGYFGTGEYPYRTLLQSKTCESICYQLSKRGYHSYVIHNNTATFYDRKDVFQKLGFDHFCSIEYMNDIEYNSIGWAKDRVLTSQILEALKADEARDFIYTITVQSHGEYPDTEYYLNQIKETDQFIGALTEALSDYDEPTVVVFFGDHQPPLSIFDGEPEENMYRTEYALWSNFPMEKVGKDLKAYQLNAYVMGRLGYDEGILTKFHQRLCDQPDYDKELKLLEYDMLYGKKYVFGGVNPFEEGALHMGIRDILITDLEEREEGIYLTGENFTPWSVVYIDNKPCKTEIIDQNTILVPVEKQNGREVYVAQVTDNNVVLSKSNVIQ